MSKSKKRDNRFKPFEGARSSDRHIRITENMLSSKAWADLKATSIKLYLGIKLRYNGSNSDSIEYPRSEAKKILSHNTITDCFRDLIQHGFIEVIREGRFARVTNIYKLSDKWQKWPEGINTKIHFGCPKVGTSTSPKVGTSKQENKPKINTS